MLCGMLQILYLEDLHDRYRSVWPWQTLKKSCKCFSSGNECQYIAMPLFPRGI